MKAKTFAPYDDHMDYMIMSTLVNRGETTQHVATMQVRDRIRQEYKILLTPHQIKGRYYTLLSRGYKTPTPPKSVKPKTSKAEVISYQKKEATTVSDVITMNVRGVEITMVFK